MNSRSTKDTCEALEPIPPDASLAELETWLKAVRYRCETATVDRRALIRESVVHQLRSVEIVSAPAKLADGFLGESSENGSASNLEGTPVALKNPEPWDGAVVGSEILEGLRDAYAQYLALPAGASVALALWVVHCHAHEAASISPILAITSPEKRCGKTTLLALLSAVVPRPLPVSNVTAATVFRAVDKWQPTLLVDEADTFLHTGSELRGILNSGHRRSLAYVPRCVGEHHEPRTFRTWAPKAVALIGKLPDTLADRSVEIRMRRRAPEEEVKRLRLDRLEKELEPLQRKAWTWAQDHISALSCADPEMPAGLHDRERDNWRPLLAIADAAGRPWLTRARNAVTALQEGERDDQSLRTRLLEDVRSILEKHSSEKIRSKFLVAKLCDLEEAPWAEYKGRGLSTMSLAQILGSFEISSKNIRTDGGVYKGYTRNAFRDAFRRYLDTPSPDVSPSDGATTLQSPSHVGSVGSRERYPADCVVDRKSGDPSHNSDSVAGVADERGSSSERGDSRSLQEDLGATLQGGS